MVSARGTTRARIESRDQRRRAPRRTGVGPFGALPTNWFFPPLFLHPGPPVDLQPLSLVPIRMSNISEIRYCCPVNHLSMRFAHLTALQLGSQFVYGSSRRLGSARATGFEICCTVRRWGYLPGVQRERVTRKEACRPSGLHAGSHLLATFFRI